MRGGIGESAYYTTFNQRTSEAASDMYYSIFDYNSDIAPVSENNYKVIVGRLSPGDNIYNKTDVFDDNVKKANIQNQVNKIKSYENTINTIQSNSYSGDLNADWPKKIIGIASNEGEGSGIDGLSDNVYMRQELNKYSASDLNCHFSELYQSNFNSGHISTTTSTNDKNEYDVDDDPSQQIYKTEINQGSSLLLYAGHADEVSLVTTGFDNTSASNLTNENKYFLGCVVGCSIGSHDEYYMSLAENLQVLANKGSIAMFVSSILQSWQPPMYIRNVN